jgi:hypothetical protein
LATALADRGDIVLQSTISTPRDVAQQAILAEIQRFHVSACGNIEMTTSAP